MQFWQFTHLATVNRRLEIEIKLVEGLDPGETCLAQPGFNAALVTSLPFCFQGLGEKGFVIHLALGGMLADSVNLGFQVIHFQLGEQVFKFHQATSS